MFKHNIHEIMTNKHADWGEGITSHLHRFSHLHAVGIDYQSDQLSQVQVQAIAERLSFCRCRIF